MLDTVLQDIGAGGHGPQASTSASSNTFTRLGLYLYWIPLGAGHHVVRISGKIYEAMSAFMQRRGRCPLFHSALVATTAEGRFVIEMTEIRDARGAERGVLAEGPVGTRWLGRFRLFRYEIRCWREGEIPDISYAVQSPVRITGDAGITRSLLELVPLVPTAVWGRDEMDAGDMWNSNSLTAWLLASFGLEAAAGRPPSGGRAPGWEAGLVAARRVDLEGVARGVTSGSTSECRDRISRHTSTPSPSGRRTSSTATSGLVAGMRVSASSAAPASPTIEMSSSASSSSRRSRRTIS